MAETVGPLAERRVDLGLTWLFKWGNSRAAVDQGLAEQGDGRDDVGRCKVGGILVVVLGVIAGVVVLGLLTLAIAGRRQSVARSRPSPARARPADQRPTEKDSDVRRLRQSVVDRAAAGGIRLPLARSGANPMIVTYTTGHPVHFYASLDAYRRDLDAQSVDPDYASWGRIAPLVVAEWTGDECRDWLADNG